MIVTVSINGETVHLDTAFRLHPCRKCSAFAILYDDDGTFVGWCKTCRDWVY